MKEQKESGLQYVFYVDHLVWVTKYRCSVLRGDITNELVKAYLEHHRKSSNSDDGKIILE